MAEKTTHVGRVLLEGHSLGIIVLVSQYTFLFNTGCCCQYTQMVTRKLEFLILGPHYANTRSYF